MSKLNLSKDKLEEYQGFIKQLKMFFDDLPDGAYLGVMESETRQWLKENKIKANPLDFYLEYSPEDNEVMTIIDLICTTNTMKEIQALFNEFIKLLNQKREYIDIPERIVCSSCQVFVDTRDGTNEDGSEIIHTVYGLRHYDPFMHKQLDELEKNYKYPLLDWEQGFPNK